MLPVGFLGTPAISSFSFIKVEYEQASYYHRQEKLNIHAVTMTAVAQR